MPIHLKAKEGEVAEKVIVTSEPETSTLISQLLENAKLVSSNRDLFVYSGTYKGTKISVAAHGFGAPSATLVLDELVQYGAKEIVKVGTAIAIRKDLKLGDFVIPTASSYLPGGSIGEYVRESFFVLDAVPDLFLTERLFKSLKKSFNVYYGPTFSNDLLYSKYYEKQSELEGKGFLCSELECASLFALSHVKGYKSGCVLLISSLLKDSGFVMLDDESLKKLIREASKGVLEALVEE